MRIRGLTGIEFSSMLLYGDNFLSHNSSVFDLIRKIGRDGRNLIRSFDREREGFTICCLLVSFLRKLESYGLESLEHRISSEF